VPDWATLPSYLSHSLNSYGHTSPDIVIFYDGFNDAEFGMAAADPWSAHYGLEIIKARAEGSLRGRFDFVHRLYTIRIFDAVRNLVRQRRKPLNDQELRAKAVSVVDNYEGNHNIASALGQVYQFRFYEFWQHMLLYGHKLPVPFEEQLTPIDSRFVGAAYQEAERRAPKTAFA